MNILICDDLPSEAVILEELLLTSGFHVNVYLFHNALDALDFIRTGVMIDCCFLDIIMPEMNGIELAAAMQNNGYSGKIIFLSTSKDYGPESYTVNAFSYLLKPPTAECVNVILGKLKRAQNRDDQGEILVQASGITKVMKYREISYVEVIRHKVYFHMIDDSEVCINATFSEVTAKLLSDPRFIQCHRSYVVNMQDIAEISEREIVTYSGRRISIPRNFRMTRSRFYQWKFGGEHQ